MPSSINIRATSANKRVGSASTDRTADRIGQEIIPACLPARQEYLMPLVQQTHQEDGNEGQYEHAPTAHSARYAQSDSEHGKYTGVSQLIPRRRNQARRDRLRATDKQGNDNPHGDQHRQQTQSSQ